MIILLFLDLLKLHVLKHDSFHFGLDISDKASLMLLLKHLEYLALFSDSLDAVSDLLNASVLDFLDDHVLYV